MRLIPLPFLLLILIGRVLNEVRVTIFHLLLSKAWKQSDSHFDFEGPLLNIERVSAVFGNFFMYWDSGFGVFFNYEGEARESFRTPSFWKQKRRAARFATPSSLFLPYLVVISSDFNTDFCVAHTAVRRW